MNRKKMAPRRGREYYAGYLKHYTKKNYMLLLLAALFLLGALLGTLLLGGADAGTRELLFRLTSGYVENRQEASLFQNFLSASGPALLFLAVMFVCGFSAVAQPLELLTPLFRGMGFGFTAASLYQNYGMQAVGFVALFLLPGTVITTLALLHCCRESLRLSGSFFGAMRSREGGLYSVRNYVARYMAAALLCVAAALLEAAVYYLFSGYFLHT